MCGRCEQQTRYLADFALDAGLVWLALSEVAHLEQKCLALFNLGHHWDSFSKISITQTCTISKTWFRFWGPYSGNNLLKKTKSEMQSKNATRARRHAHTFIASLFERIDGFARPRRLRGDRRRRLDGHSAAILHLLLCDGDLVLARLARCRWARAMWDAE